MIAAQRRPVLVLDQEPNAFPEFFGALGKVCEPHVHSSLEQLFADEHNHIDPVFLLDIATLQAQPTAHVGALVERRNRVKMGLMTHQGIEDYLFDLRRWGLMQITIKTPPIDPEEVDLFLMCVRDPFSGFGLSRYLRNTVEMYNISVSTIEEKNQAIERVINQFASAGFEIHELYDVRLILEETVNNALFHAFRNPAGEEKYHISSFRGLEPGERVRIEFGSNAETAGFTVSDTAGSLPVKTIVGKLERQYNREGVFDESGRGLYLSRMLSSAFIMNIEAGKRTQVVALFNDLRRSDRPKPFMVNYIGEDTFPEWCLDPELE